MRPNGRIESVNTKIRLITRIAFGFRTPRALIALAMLSLGGHKPHLQAEATHTSVSRAEKNARQIQTVDPGSVAMSRSRVSRCMRGGGLRKPRVSQVR